MLILILQVSNLGHRELSKIPTRSNVSRRRSDWLPAEPALLGGSEAHASFPDPLCLQRDPPLCSRSEALVCAVAVLSTSSVLGCQWVQWVLSSVQEVFFFFFFLNQEPAEA